MNGWRKYLDEDFGNMEEEGFHVDGYVYCAGIPEDKPYRHIQFCWCYIPEDKRNDIGFIGDEEAECKQYIEDLTEEEAKETIEWYLENMELLRKEKN